MLDWKQGDGPPLKTSPTQNCKAFHQKPITSHVKLFEAVIALSL